MTSWRQVMWHHGIMSWSHVTSRHDTMPPPPPPGYMYMCLSHRDCLSAQKDFVVKKILDYGHGGASTLGRFHQKITTALENVRYCQYSHEMKTPEHWHTSCVGYVQSLGPKVLFPNGPTQRPTDLVLLPPQAKISTYSLPGLMIGPKTPKLNCQKSRFFDLVTLTFDLWPWPSNLA